MVPSLTKEGLLERSDKHQPPFDAVLRRDLEARRNPGASDCPDAATLAAYFERSLSVPESSRWEEHFSSCARCQGALAAVARAQTPQDGAPVVGFSRRWELYAALAAGVAGISIVAGLTRTARHQVTPAMMMARNELAASAQVMELGLKAKQGTPARQSGPMIALNEPAPLANPAIAEGPLSDRPTAGPVPETGSSTLALRRSLRKEAKPGHIASRELKSAYPPSASEFRAESSPVGATGAPQPSANAAPGARPESAQVPAAPAAPPAPATSEEDVAESSAPAPPPAGFGGGMPSPQPGGPAAQTAYAGRSLRMVWIRTADGIERWRLGEHGIIEHFTSDRGWIRQDSGVATNLTAGSAPSPNACWVVGSGGTILRTDDGERWQRVGSPTSANFAAVSAIDASSATVTTADGRRFFTSDTGRTWRPM